MGALGPVFRTYEPTRDRLVAVKVFRLDVIPEQAQALADELAHAAEAELIHPSIVEPIAAGVEGTVAYRAEEYVAAESLDSAMRHHAPATFDTMLRIVGQLAEAVDAARHAGVGHGALHPRDIFITPDEARASGFGVVDALERVGLRAPVRRPYSPPERVAGAAWSTPADVFSLGAIAFELLTGRRPSGTGAEIGPLTGAVAPEAERLQPVLARAMAEQPEDRFATGLALADALAAAGMAAAATQSQSQTQSQSLLVPAVFADEDEGPGEGPAVAALEADPTAIQMIALPAEAPVFADESRDRASATTPSLFVEVPYSSPLLMADRAAVVGAGEPDDIAAERDEDEAHWALTRDEDDLLAAGSIGAGDLAAAEYPPADVEAAADALVFDAAELTLRDQRRPDDDMHRGSPAERETLATPPPADVEAAADALAFDAADLALWEDRGPGDDRHRVSRAEPEALTLPPPADSEEPPVVEDAYDAAFEPPRFEGTTERVPQQVIERQIPPLSSQDADGRAPFEEHGGTGERSRPAVLPLALMLLIGLVIGYLARGLQSPRPVASVANATVPPATATPAAAEPTGTPEGTGGTAPSRPGSNRPAPAPAAAPRPAAAPAARSGTLVVRSAPSGAGVTLNGKWSGRTPLTQRALPFGDYTVRVILPGYQSRPEQVTLSADAAARTLVVPLQKDAARATPTAAAPRPAPAASPRTAETPSAATTGAATGGLEIDSRPAGARVFVDDRAVGATPVRLPDVPPGSHVVRLELPDHRVWTETAQVSKGKTTRVAGSLEAIR